MFLYEIKQHTFEVPTYKTVIMNEKKNFVFFANNFMMITFFAYIWKQYPKESNERKRKLIVTKTWMK